MKGRMRMTVWLNNISIALLMMVTTCFSFSAMAEEETTTAVVYDPVASLNTAAGDLGIGGANHVNGTVGTITYDSVFSLAGADTTEWKHPDQNIDLNKMKVESDAWNNALCFYPADYQYDGTTYSMTNGYIKILEYTKDDPASRALWWACGEDWYCQKVMLTFTAPESGKYDIGASSNFPNVTLTNNALGGISDANADKEITLAIKKGDEVLASVGVSKNATSKAFPALSDVELSAGETITFCVSAPAELRATWWGTVIEAVPVVTLKEIDKANVAPTLTVEKTDVATLIDNAVTLKLTAFDANSDAITVSQTVEAANGNVTVDLTAGTLSYTPKAGFVGEDTFALKATDGELESEIVTVKVGVYKGISAAVAAIKANMAYFYEKPQGGDWLDIDQTICDWQWQVAYDGLLGTNEQGWRVGEMAMYNQWGITLAHTDSPAMNITEHDILLLNCDKPIGLNAKGGLTYVAPEDGLYKLTHTDVMATIGLDEWRVLNPESVWEGDRYTTPVYVSITKDNKIVWPADGKPLKLDPNDKENFRVEFPEVITAMKKGDSLRIVVEMDDECKSWMNRVWCDPVVYNVGDYDAAKDLNPSDAGDNNQPGDDNDQPGGDNNQPGGDNNQPGGDSDQPADDNDNESTDKEENVIVPDTGDAFPIAMMVLFALFTVALAFTAKKNLG